MRGLTVRIRDSGKAYAQPSMLPAAERCVLGRRVRAGFEGCARADSAGIELVQANASVPRSTSETLLALTLGGAGFFAASSQKLAGCDQLPSPLGEQRPVQVTRA